MFHLKTHSLEKKLFDWISSSESQQSFLEGAILISQYGQMEEDIPNLREKVEKNLEHITNRVNELADKSDANQQKEKKILATVHQVIFSEMGFVKQNLRNDSLFDNFYIDKVDNRSFIFQTCSYLIYKICFKGSRKEKREYVDNCNHLQRGSQKGWDYRRTGFLPSQRPHSCPTEMEVILIDSINAAPRVIFKMYFVF